MIIYRTQFGQLCLAYAGGCRFHLNILPLGQYFLIYQKLDNFLNSEFTAPENTTKILSFNAGLQLIGLVVVPMLNGFIVDTFKSYRLPFIVAGLLMCTGGVLCILARITYKLSRR